MPQAVTYGSTYCDIVPQILPYSTTKCHTVPQSAIQYHKVPYSTTKCHTVPQIAPHTVTHLACTLHVVTRWRFRQSAFAFYAAINQLPIPTDRTGLSNCRSAEKKVKILCRQHILQSYSRDLQTFVHAQRRLPKAMAACWTVALVNTRECSWLAHAQLPSKQPPNNALSPHSK
jgi:hypothetical protein